jgi:hypothetical protein
MKKLLLLLSFVVAPLFTGCDPETPRVATSASGVRKADTTVQTGSDGLTVEQRNIKGRLAEDNKPGAIKHLYVISPYSGQVIIYSTVKGKVTSGGKRLSPSTIVAGGSGEWRQAGFPIGNRETAEILGDDGVYGNSGDYLYWWDVQGRYHQHYLTGGQILHIADAPLPVKSITINMEVSP